MNRPLDPAERARQLEQDAAESLAATAHLNQLCKCGHTLDDHDFPGGPCFEGDADPEGRNFEPCGCEAFEDAGEREATSEDLSNLLQRSLAKLER